MPSSVEAFCKACNSNPAVLCCVNTFKWVPVLFIVAVVAWSYYAYVIELCLLTVDNIFEKILYIALYHVFLFLFLWAYYQTIFATIGAPLDNFVLPRTLVEELKSATRPSDHRLILDKFMRERSLPVTMRAFDGAIRYCEKCTCIKPDRSHHCSVCGQCVLKFDHHCPWVNTCVNYRNYKFFIQFLGYALVFCIYIFLTDIQYFIWFWTTGLQKGGASKFHIMFMFFVSGMFSISVSALFFYHLWLTGKNRSTIESFRAPVFTYGPDADGFSLGWKENFKEVFGTNRCLWFLPIFSSRGDGCEYGTPNLHNRPPFDFDTNNRSRNRDQEMSGSVPRNQRDEETNVNFGPAPNGGNYTSPYSNGGISENVEGGKAGSPNKAFWVDERANERVSQRKGEQRAENSDRRENNPQSALPFPSGGFWKGEQGQSGPNYQTFASRGDGLVYPMPMIDPEVDSLLNTRHQKWEDDEDSASSDYDNHVAFGSQVRQERSPYNPGNNNSLRQYGDEPSLRFDHQSIPMASVPVVVTQS